MEKEVMMKAVKKALQGMLNDSDLCVDTCEVVWEELFTDSEMDATEDAIMTKLFDECYNELLKKINTCLREIHV